MASIWKFPVSEESTVNYIEMPAGAKILTAQRQGNGPVCIWSICDGNIPRVRRMIEVFGTGWNFENNSKRKHISTIQDDGGALIWHIFDNGELPL